MNAGGGRGEGRMRRRQRDARVETEVRCEWWAKEHALAARKLLSLFLWEGELFVDGRIAVVHKHHLRCIPLPSEEGDILGLANVNIVLQSQSNVLECANVRTSASFKGRFRHLALLVLSIANIASTVLRVEYIGKWEWDVWTVVRKGDNGCSEERIYCL